MLLENTLTSKPGFVVMKVIGHAMTHFPQFLVYLWIFCLDFLAVSNILCQEVVKNIAYSYNDGPNILRLFDTILNFVFTASEAKRDYQ